MVDQPNPDVPVYVVQNETNSEVKKTLHRNLLLPIGFLSGDQAPGDSVEADAPHKHPVLDTHNADIIVQPASDDPDDDSSSNEDDTVYIEQPDSMNANPISDFESEHDVESDESEHDVDPNAESEDEELDSNPERNHVDVLPVPAVPADDPVPDVDVIPAPAARPVNQPVPAPRRGTRTRRQPEWIRSDQYAMSQVPMNNIKADGVVKFISAIGHLMTQINND